jgi:TrmH family RNA methyltransferase
MKTIVSPDNPLMKTIRRLQQRTGRRPKGRFLLEGVKLAVEALQSPVTIEQVVFSCPFAESDTGRSLAARFEAKGVPLVAVRQKIFARASSLDSPEGVLLIARRPTLPLASITGEPALVVAGVQDPGNLGAMARVAEAASVSALVICRGSADPFQPKALRASMGSLVRLTVLQGGEPASALCFLKEQGLSLIVCLPRDGDDFRKVDLRRPLALVMGSESTGVPETLVALADRRISVPMRPTVESLNVAVVTGLVLYEVARQRGTL